MRAWGLRPRGARADLAMAIRPVLPSEGRKPSALRMKTFSRLNTQPARTPVNASTAPLPMLPHDSGPVWLARPSPYETFIHNTSPALAGAHVRVSCPVGPVEVQAIASRRVPPAIASFFRNQLSSKRTYHRLYFRRDRQQYSSSITRLKFSTLRCFVLAPANDIRLGMKPVKRRLAANMKFPPVQGSGRFRHCRLSQQQILD